MNGPRTTPARPGASLAPVISQKEYAPMSTTLLERPAMPAAAVNGTQMRAQLDAEAASLTLMDKIKAMPAKARGWFTGILTTLRESAVAGTLASVWNRVKGLLARATGGKGGIIAIIASLVTCQAGRRFIYTTGATAYRIVSAPFKWVGKFIGGIIGNFAWGRTVNAWVADKVARAEAWLAGKAFDAFAWLEAREHTLGMQVVRSFSQYAVGSNLVKGFVPERFQTVAQTAVVLAPNVGVGSVKHGVEWGFPLSLLMAAEDVVEQPTLTLVGDKPTTKASKKAMQVATIRDDATGTVREVEVAKVVKTKVFENETGRIFDADLMTDSTGAEWVAYNGFMLPMSEVAGDLVLGEQVAAAKRLYDAKATREAVETAAEAVVDGDVPGMPRPAKRAVGGGKQNGRR